MDLKNIETSELIECFKKLEEYLKKLEKQKV